MKKKLEIIGFIAALLIGLTWAISSFREQQTNWNTKDLDASKNGNAMVAANLLKELTDEEIKRNAEDLSAATIMKSPYRYYGKIVKIQGEVSRAQDYPPDSDWSKVLGGGEVGDLGIRAEDSTAIIYLHLGSTGDINNDDVVVVYGYPIGNFEEKNAFGVAISGLMIVGKTVEKVTP